jgi:5-methylcytosine-specific restriction protein A
MPRRALTTCTRPGCPSLTAGGRCDDCATSAERERGTSSQRGYGKRHRQRFRASILERDICCVLCRPRGEWTLATVADHWPLSRRELTDRGLDADDPQHGRGLCATCHNRETAANQPGGWNAGG